MTEQTIQARSSWRAGEVDEAMSSDTFFQSLPTIERFDAISDPSNYRSLPDDWEIGLSDVVSSTAAIESGRYKSVNLAGAAVISAVSNALGTIDFPYVFTGDGMAYAVGPRQAERARKALAASVRWVASELNLTLRGAVMPVSALRERGKDVSVARFGASDQVAYAMFTGGGLRWLERALKDGDLPPLVPEPDARPDLTGLSCRFRPVPARNGLVASLIVTPRASTQEAEFQALVRDVLALASRQDQALHPLAGKTLRLTVTPESFGSEVRLARRDGQSFLKTSFGVAGRTLIALLVMTLGRDVGRFSPARYRNQLVENSDFRKYEDGLMLTLDCTPALADEIEARLLVARTAGLADFGLYRQSAALITCFVPSPLQANHVHFVDGANGGYALAARALKQSVATASLGSSPEREGVTSS